MRPAWDLNPRYSESSAKLLSLLTIQLNRVWTTIVNTAVASQSQRSLLNPLSEIRNSQPVAKERFSFDVTSEQQVTSIDANLDSYAPTISARAYPSEDPRTLQLTSSQASVGKTYSANVTDLKGGKQYKLSARVASSVGNSNAMYETPYVREFENIASSNKIKVGAHYYPSYGPRERWPDSNSPLEPLLGYYDSSDPMIASKHADWAGGNGISFFLASWWGPNGYAGRMNDTRNIEMLFINEVFKDLAITLGYETYASGKGFVVNPDGTIDFSNPSNQRLLFSDFDYLAERYFHQDNYLKFEGRPVVNILWANSFRGDAAGVFSSLRKRMLAQGFDLYIIGNTLILGEPPSTYSRLNEQFDALSTFLPYSQNRDVVGNSTGQEFENTLLALVEEAFAEWNLYARGTGKTFVPCVMPGFDNTHASWGDKNEPTIPRSLDFYDKSMRLALKHVDERNPIITIGTWNDFGENTWIEPTVEEGFSFLKLTRQRLYS
jgi:hypothetical protein